MRIVRVLLPALAFLATVVAPSRSAKVIPPVPAVREPGSPPDYVIIGPAEVTSWLDRLEEFGAGRAVIAAGPAWFSPADDKPFHKAERFSETAAEFARRVGTEAPLSVFTVRGAWIIAPAMRQDVRTDYTGISPLDASARGLLLDELLVSLTPEQIKRVGTDAGLPVPDLRPEQRALLERALRPPLQVDRTGADEDDPNGSPSTRKVQQVDQPLDWSRGSLRARLSASASVPMLRDGDGAMSVTATGDIGDAEYSVNRAGWMETDDFFAPVDLPEPPDVPNTRKPSDLDGAGYTAPVAMSGQAYVEEVVAQLAKVSGLRLSVDLPYRKLPVFLGSRALQCGQVMDGLCLCLEAAWRKVGGGYVLCWDRRGVGALKQLVAESSAEVANALAKKDGEVHSDKAWVTLASSLPFAPDDPLALTEAQRRRIFEPSEDESPEVHFADMTPEQQEYLRKLVKRDTMNFTMEGGHGSPGDWHRLDGTPIVYPEEKLQKATLANNIEVTLAVSADPYGWVRLPTRQAVMAMGLVFPASDIEESPAPEPAPKPKMSPRPVSAEVRGLMVPPLPSARLAELAGEMKRAGLNVLFYPALAHGYATFASRMFPLEPALDGANGLADAVRAMKPQSIKVVATVDVLTWQAEGRKDHWLNRYPGWLDVDIAGRPRLQWIRRRPDLARDVARQRTYLSGSEDAPDVQTLSRGVLGDVLLPANYVRPQEPGVQKKLQVFMDELAKRDGLAGVAFDGWKPSVDPGSPALTPPALGYGVPERAAALAAGQRDPVDVAAVSGPPHPRIFGDEDLLLFWAEDERSAAPAPRPHEDLVSELLRRARAARPQWKTWLVTVPDRSVPDLPGEPERPRDPLPPADFNLVADAGTYEAPAALLHVWPSSLATGPELEALAGLPSVAWLNRNLGGPDSAARKAMVFDLRTAPEEISENLKWLRVAPPNPRPDMARPQGMTPPAVEPPAPPEEISE